jgi:membrane peptidoglycan carboxypeptidase
LINPVRYSPARPPARLLRRQQIILARMGSVEPPAPPSAMAPRSEEPIPHEAPEAPVADAVPTAGGETPQEEPAPAPAPD